jgi:hypothetical protein
MIERGGEGKERKLVRGGKANNLQSYSRLATGNCSGSLGGRGAGPRGSRPWHDWAGLRDEELNYCTPYSRYSR